MPTITPIFEHDDGKGNKGTLGIDENSRLYWNGRRVVMEQKVRFSWWVNFAVIVGGVSTLLIAILTALMYFKPR